MAAAPLEPGHQSWPKVEEAWLHHQNGLSETRIAEAMNAPRPSVQHWLGTMKRYLANLGVNPEPTEPYKPQARTFPKRDTERVLIIGDIHEPFCLSGYLDFCAETRDKYECTHTVFIGDVIDNHYSSYHEADPDGMGAGDELALAKSRIAKWAEEFPDADVAIGNHDRIITRKAFSSGVSRQWVREYSEVLGTPGWNFQEEFVYDDVCYSHGEGGTARTRIKKELTSRVQGHLHTQAYVEWLVGSKYRIFGMQVGCGIDHRSYAMAYSKGFPKPAISVGLVLDHGQDAFVKMMRL